MTTVVATVALVVAVFAVVATAAAVWFDAFSHTRPDWVISRQARRRVIVTATSGDAFTGLLVDADRRSVRLVDAAALTGAQSTPTPVDGDLLIPRDQIAYVQFP